MDKERNYLGPGPLDVLVPEDHRNLKNSENDVASRCVFVNNTNSAVLIDTLASIFLTNFRDDS